jgi:hypothetical protein
VKEETARAKQETARAKQNSARAKQNIAGGNEEISRANDEIARAKEEIARAKEETARAKEETEEAKWASYYTAWDEADAEELYTAWNEADAAAEELYTAWDHALWIEECEYDEYEEDEDEEDRYDKDEEEEDSQLASSFGPGGIDLAPMVQAPAGPGLQCPFALNATTPDWRQNTQVDEYLRDAPHCRRRLCGFVSYSAWAQHIRDRHPYIFPFLPKRVHQDPMPEPRRPLVPYNPSLPIEYRLHTSRGQYIDRLPADAVDGSCVHLHAHAIRMLSKAEVEGVMCELRCSRGNVSIPLDQSMCMQYLHEAIPNGRTLTGSARLCHVVATMRCATI